MFNKFTLMDEDTPETAFTPVRHVMVPTLTLEEDVDYTFKILSPFRWDTTFKGKDAGEGDSRRKPARVARVLPFTAEGAKTREHTLVGGTVLVDTLEREYTDDGYVGRIFTVRKLPKKEGTGYFRYDIMEVELAEKRDKLPVPPRFPKNPADSEALVEEKVKLAG
ncbi:MAG: hypothetical protein L0209_12900 [candidate division Zixibacteria bacterium]|nr:hypothetical protein [candidate division Zixibacteria bacterium]